MSKNVCALLKQKRRCCGVGSVSVSYDGGCFVLGRLSKLPPPSTCPLPTPHPPPKNNTGPLPPRPRVQGVLDRQKERESQGDNVPYVLARTVWSNLQYEAALLIGCTGAGSQCLRGECFARAIGMFSGKGMEGIPREVVLALLRHGKVEI